MKHCIQNVQFQVTWKVLLGMQSLCLVSSQRYHLSGWHAVVLWLWVCFQGPLTQCLLISEVYSKIYSYYVPNGLEQLI